MANVKISGLPAATSVTAGTDVAPLVSGGITTKATPQQIVNAGLLAPGAIGSGTASTGAFTTLSASSTVSGTGFSTYLASPPAIGGTAPSTGKFTTIESTIATGTAPFTVASTTNVANLNASSLGGATFASPGAIGSGTASTGAFTTLSASSTVSGTGFSTYLASPPAIGGTAAAAGAFTTLSASSTVSGTGFSTYLLSPPAIGTTAPAAGKFTDLTSTGNTTIGDASTDTFTVYPQTISLINSTAITAASTKTLTLNGGAGSNGLVIDASNNVGIGYSSSFGKLSINSNGAPATSGNMNTGFVIGNGTNGTALNMGTNDAGGYNWFNSAYINSANVGRPLAFFIGGTERMRLDASGIVTMNAYGAGAATFSAAGVISSVSDETWKTKDGAPVDTDAMLKKLEPGYWYYNDEKKEIFGVDRQLGFYAQNVNAAIGPEAAPEPEEGKPWGYYDRSVLAVVVMSLQKALSTIESLEDRLAKLEAK